MRSFKDRIRHTVLFEAIALVIVSIGGSWITGHSIESLGALAIMMSLLAMIWNLIYNWLFDHWDRKYRNSAPRGPIIRIFHALIFEAVFLIVGLFMTVWWLAIGYWDALMLDIGFAAFFLVYTYAYNWAYDHVFPVGQSA